MTAFRWGLVVGVVVVGIAAMALAKREMPGLIGSTLAHVFPPVDPASMKAKVQRLPAPEGPRMITFEIPVVPGAAAWSDVAAEARFSAAPPSCLRSTWSQGPVPHIEVLALPVRALGDNRFVVHYHDQVLAPGELYAKGDCRWFPEGIRIIARAVPDRASGQRRQAHIHLASEAVLDLEPQAYACVPAVRDGLLMQCVRRGSSAPLLEPLPEVSLRVSKPPR